MSAMKLEDRIFEIVQGSSGGIKFLNLITRLVMHGDEFDDFTVDEIEQAVRSHAKLKVLDYSWDMGAGMKRAKMFVYTE